MNVVKKERNSSNSSGLANKAKQGLSKSQPINLYQEIPTLEVSLDDFEEFALDRLKVRLIGPFVTRNYCWCMDILCSLIFPFSGP